MWQVVTQLPKRAVGVGVRLWGLFLHLLSRGFVVPLLWLLMLLRVLCVCVQKGVRVVVTAACSVALRAHACSAYIFLQGVAWFAQLVGSSVTLPMQLFGAVLETLTRIPLTALCEQAARRLVQAGVWATRGLARVWGPAMFAQLCAHWLFIGLCLCMHACLSTISSKVHVRVHVPFCFSLPVQVHVPLSLGIRMRLWGSRPGGAGVEVGTPQGEPGEERKPRRTRNPKPARRREVSRSRSAFRPGG